MKKIAKSVKPDLKHFHKGNFKIKGKKQLLQKIKRNNELVMEGAKIDPEKLNFRFEV